MQTFWVSAAILLLVQPLGNAFLWPVKSVVRAVPLESEQPKIATKLKTIEDTGIYCVRYPLPGFGDFICAIFCVLWKNVLDGTCGPNDNCFCRDN